VLKKKASGHVRSLRRQTEKKELRATATANIVAAIELSNEALVLRIDTIVREEGVDALRFIEPSSGLVYNECRPGSIQ
jgi:hypothetical protein